MNKINSGIPDPEFQETKLIEGIKANLRSKIQRDPKMSQEDYNSLIDAEAGVVLQSLNDGLKKLMELIGSEDTIDGSAPRKKLRFGIDPITDKFYMDFPSEDGIES